ncbi:MAG: peptidoglycan DD-metalloendopeptidase family protein [Bacteroidota bacterium]|nr:peptidoglycan DD-metalloendopeptidase family protein [Bacteroidota bacterium]MDP4216238.1 peptidoglycan DD-metalloendopeptidase family protein [Bacteroidota bacterium]MDP4246625.1 peptidoglycan DD-metalloendopeptidase family protein [Bacteroidota bacterium]MDP4254213.1 peptidoglycan DD-metalloendopeptidase family protein [Bacteroidota bacterium]MDP4256764.1 peptidoglycan DD-metalloendopeptidase family protein [Bacteroidota bacterium]
MSASSLRSILQDRTIHPVVPFDPDNDRLYRFDFTDKNTDLLPDQVADTESFARHIESTLGIHHCRYGVGGYAEHRTLYARSRHFDTSSGPRRLHLGTDIWGPAGTKVMAPLGGIVHSFAFNNQDGDYGATLILTHNLEGFGFHTLYGHLSLNSLKNLHEGMRVRGGDTIGEFGMRFENGNWPPHLHFQLILDLQDWKGDYPGVCKFSEKEQWLANCPDPDLLLHMSIYAEQ